MGLVTICQDFFSQVPMISSGRRAQSFVVENPNDVVGIYLAGHTHSAVSPLIGACHASGVCFEGVLSPDPSFRS